MNFICKCTFFWCTFLFLNYLSLLSLSDISFSHFLSSLLLFLSSFIDNNCNFISIIGTSLNTLTVDIKPSIFNKGTPWLTIWKKKLTLLRLVGFPRPRRRDAGEINDWDLVIGSSFRVSYLSHLSLITSPFSQLHHLSSFLDNNCAVFSIGSSLNTLTVDINAMINNLKEKKTLMLLRLARFPRPRRRDAGEINDWDLVIESSFGVSYLSHLSHHFSIFSASSSQLISR